MRTVVLDRRGGRPDTWVILPEGVSRLVQVPDAARFCAVFLYYKDRAACLQTAGTAFFVGRPIVGHPNNGAAVLLTAHHVISGIQRASTDRKVYVRGNSLAGLQNWVETSVDDWVQAGTLDAAAYFFPYDPDLDFHHTVWRLDGDVLTTEVARREGISAGDEVFTVGLFSYHAGTERIEPIVRVGNIAAFPTERVYTGETYGPTPAVLIEARSIAGLSGSPVFVHKGLIRSHEDTEYLAVNETQRHYLMGIMHGHWPLDRTIDGITPSELEDNKIHTGIAIVLPIENVLGELEPLLQEHAETHRKALDGRNAPVMDSSVDSDPEFDRFEDMARQVLNTPEEAIKEEKDSHRVNSA